MEAPHMAACTREVREEEEEEKETTYGIYNYITEEKWGKQYEKILTFNDFKADIFNKFIWK